MAKYYIKVALEWEGEVEADSLIDAQDIAMEIADNEGNWCSDGEEIIDDEEYDYLKYAFTYVTYDLAGEEMTKEAYFTFEKYVDKWYITSFRFE